MFGFLVLLAVLAPDYSRVVDGSGCHLLIGGKGSSGWLTSAEAVNLTSKTSQLRTEELPVGLSSHSGGVLDNNPVVCGGIISDTEDSKACYKHSGTNWSEEVAVLPSQSYSAGNAIVDEKNNEMYIFGGANFPSAPPIKILEYKNNKWRNGTTVYDDGIYYGHCTVLVKRTVYFFGLGGKTDGKTIATLDLDSPNATVVKLDVSLETNRFRSSCVEVNGTVYLIGGLSVGLEIFDTESETSELYEAFPDDYLVSSQALVDGDNIFVYGGEFQYELQKSVHMFSTKSLNWTVNYMELTESKRSFVALPVEDSFCQT